MNLKQIIQAECACYFREGPLGNYDWCDAHDARCVAFGTFKPCKYFKECVLPAQPDAAAEYAELVRRDAEQQELGVGPEPQYALRRSRMPLEAYGHVKQVYRDVHAEKQLVLTI
jgi:hypothetical protein